MRVKTRICDYIVDYTCCGRAVEYLQWISGRSGYHTCRGPFNLAHHDATGVSLSSARRSSTGTAGRVSNVLVETVPNMRVFATSFILHLASCGGRLAEREDPRRPATFRPAQKAQLFPHRSGARGIVRVPGGAQCSVLADTKAEPRTPPFASHVTERSGGLVAREHSPGPCRRLWNRGVPDNKPQDERLCASRSTHGRG